jgi:hypothetical protein
LRLTGRLRNKSTPQNFPKLFGTRVAPNFRIRSAKNQGVVG